MSNNILEINDLSKVYKGFILDKVSFSIEKGTVMGLIGQNGAGKTTIIKLIMNMFDCEGGTITVCGKDNIGDEIFVKNKIGYVADESYFFVNTTAKKIGGVCSAAYENWDGENSPRC